MYFKRAIRETLNIYKEIVNVSKKENDKFILIISLHNLYMHKNAILCHRLKYNLFFTKHQLHIFKKMTRKNTGTFVTIS